MCRATCVFALIGLAGMSLEAQTSATIYTDGRVFVRHQISHEIPAGTSTVPLPFEDAVPGSLIALDEGVSIESARFSRALTPAGLVRRLVGQRLTFTRAGSGDTSSALVLPGDPVRYQLADGSVVFNFPGTAIYPGSVAGPGRLAEAVIRSDRPRSTIEVGYLVSGASWEASYALTITGRGARLGGTVTIASESVALDSARIVVVDGFVPRPPPPPPADQLARSQAAIGQMLNSLSRQPATERPAALPPRAFDLGHRLSVRPGESVSIPILSPATVSIEEVLSVPGILANLTRTSRNDGVAVPVALTYRIGRSAGRDTVSYPPGTVRIFRDMDRQGLMLIGEGRIEGAEGQEPLELSLGASQEITATRTVGESVPVRDTVMSAAGGVNIRTVATTLQYALRFRNHSKTARTVEVIEGRQEEWAVLSSSVPAETIGPGIRRFRITVPPGAEQEFRAHLRLRVQ